MTERVAAGVEDLPQDVTRHANVKKKKKLNSLTDTHTLYFLQEKVEGKRTGKGGKGVQMA